MSYSRVNSRNRLQITFFFTVKFISKKKKSQSSHLCSMIAISASFHGPFSTFYHHKSQFLHTTAPIHTPCKASNFVANSLGITLSCVNMTMVWKNLNDVHRVLTSNPSNTFWINWTTSQALLPNLMLFWLNGSKCLFQNFVEKQSQ